MRTIYARLVCSFLLLVAVFAAKFASAQTDLVENGGFETGDFVGWTVLNEPEGGGNWYVYSGTTLPETGFSFLSPPVGVFAATTDQFRSGSHVLYQDLAIPVGGEVLCTAILYYQNLAPEFFTGSDLSYLTSPNQQARVDIISTDADPFTSSDGVLLNILQTQPGDPLTLGYTAIDFDLSQFAGSTVRFRVAEVDNVSYFNFAIDEVSCISDIAPPTTSIPTLGEWGMMAMAGVLGIAGLFYARRKRLLN